MARYKQVIEEGITFRFKYDLVDPSILHIYARHLTEIDDALDVFFDTKSSWNKEFQRFENYSNTHGLYWFWLNESKKEVQIISCFRI